MLTRRHYVIYFIVFTNLVGAGVVVPTLPLYAEGRFGATAIDAAFFIALYHIAQFFAAPLLGQLSDKIGRRPVLIGSQIGTILSFLMFIYATEIGIFLDNIGLGFLGTGLFLLYFARTLDGITGGNITAAQAYITDITPEKDRAQALGYAQSAFGLGLVFGPAFGGALANVGLRAPFVGAAAITSLSLLMTILVLRETRQPQATTPSISHSSFNPRNSSWAYLLGNSTTLIILSLSFTVSFTIASISAIFPLFAARVVYPHVLDEAIVARNVGYLLAYVGFAAVVSQVFVLKRLVDRVGEQNTILIAIASASLTTLGLTYLTHSWILVLAVTPAAFSYAIGIPSGQALLMRIGDPKMHGQLIGLYHSVNSLAYVIGPLIGGIVFEQYGPRSPFTVASIMVIAALGLAIVLKARTIPQAYSVRG